MGEGDCFQPEMATFRVAGFSDMLDWRPMLFQEPVVAQRSCVLCGVLYKKAIRLPCLHTLCIKCHSQRVNEGSMCPVDQEPFCEDDVDQLEVSHKFILNRQVACWSAPKGCRFIGPAASLVDHYKECDFTLVSCCLCHSSVLRNNILAHFKNGCTNHQATCEPANNHTTQDHKDISRALHEVKKQISEDFMSLQTILNRCVEDVGVEGAKGRSQLEAEASRLNEHLGNLSKVCISGFAEEVHNLQVAMTDYKGHLSNELSSIRDELTTVKSLSSPSRPKTEHWYFKHWANLKKQVLESGWKRFEGPKWSMHGYCVSQVVELERVGNELQFGSFMRIHPGEHDLELEWPFRNVYTVGVIHPVHKSKVISFKLNAGWYANEPSFLLPKIICNPAFGRSRLSRAEKLQEDGFVQCDTLHVFLEIKP